MRTKNHKYFTLILAMLVIMLFSVNPVNAGSTQNVSVKVGSMANLSFTPASYEVIMSNTVRWYSNSPAVSIVSSGISSCRIQVNYMSSVPVIVRCDYNYLRNNLAMTGYADFYVTTVNSGDSSVGTGTYSLTPSTSRVYLDTNGYVSFTITAGVKLSSDVYIEQNSSSGNLVSVEENGVSGTTVKYVAYGHGVGTQYVVFNLIRKDGNTRIIKDKISIRFDVSCSHIWNAGTVVQAPTSTTAGKRLFICNRCGEQKVESIPVIAVKTDIASCSIAVGSGGSYTGSAHTPDVTVKDGIKTLTKGTDYTLSYSGNVDAGTGTVVISGIGNYSGSVSKSFTIAKAEQKIQLPVSSVSIKKGEVYKLSANGIGSISYTSSNNSIVKVDSSGTVTGIASGSAVITVTASGNKNYKAGSSTIMIKVTENTSAAKITASTYVVSLKEGGSQTLMITAEGTLPSRYYFNSIVSDSGISASWTGDWINKKSHAIKLTAVKAGKYTLTCRLMDSASGKAVASTTISVTVEKKTQTIVLQTPVVKALNNTASGIYIKWGLVTNAKKYMVYRRVNSGAWKKLVTTNAYFYTDNEVVSGSTYRYKIVAVNGTTTSKDDGKAYQLMRLNTPVIKSIVSPSARKMQMSVTMYSKSTGFQVQYCSNKTFVGATTKKYTNTASGAYRITYSGMKQNRTYYFRIRSYKVVSGFTYYSSWSTAKSIKIK